MSAWDAQRARRTGRLVDADNLQAVRDELAELRARKAAEAAAAAGEPIQLGLFDPAP